MTHCSDTADSSSDYAAFGGDLVSWGTLQLRVSISARQGWSDMNSVSTWREELKELEWRCTPLEPRSDA